MSAVAAFASVDPTVGFQMSAEMARSKAAIVTSTIAVRPIQTDWVRFHTAINKSASTADCSAAWPMPPACGRFSNQGPNTTRIVHRTQ